MFKPLPIAIGLRYLRAKRRNGFISFISMASIVGIALGVAVLITTLSVMGGFQREIRDRLLQMAAHATVAADGRNMTEWPQAIKLALQDPRVEAAAPYVDTQALLTGNDKAPAIIRGVLPDRERKVSVIGDKLVVGSLDSLTPGSYNILLGKELADILGVRVGDSVLVATSGLNVTGLGAVPQMKRFVVSGVFEAGHQEFDKGLAVVRMEDLQLVQRMGDGVTGVRLKLHDMDLAWAVARDLALKLGGGYRVNDWMHENGNIFRAIRMERTMMAILLSLIIAMGAFNLVSSQVMLVTDKQADIAIQRTLGMTPGQVMRIFMVQGSLIGIIGTVIGVVGGVLLTLNLEHILKLIERVFHVTLLPEDVYYITGLPTDLRADTVAIIAAVALAMAFLATLYPAWRASRTPPAEALRYE
ncbi:lipoprotein-releasing ABC transporter permease subunit [Solilutibacter silvestris]|uniref:LolCE: LolC/E family transmembrane protein n=1 Tax=Solilutibacter silvestris TaxID=1645665 RepID=A0A2K1PYE9_9GAMM|nr:lipoprotein-releasing ABC transporter permease subunit [Lysobacter silvestris]PNS07811.1 lolCE: LolC/E family transmembrane protein [Lysobacter silvestris]